MTVYIDCHFPLDDEAELNEHSEQSLAAASISISLWNPRNQLTGFQLLRLRGRRADVHGTHSFIHDDSGPGAYDKRLSNTGGPFLSRSERAD